MAEVRELEAGARVGRENGAGGGVSLQDFCCEPRRSAVLGRFPGYPRAEVEDAFSFAIEKGMHSLCREESEVSIGAWLHQVMSRCLSRVMARQRVVAPSGGFELDAFVTSRPSPEQEVLRAERCREVVEFVDTLPERTAQVLRARYFEDLSRGEVAEGLRLTEKQVKRELEGAMEALEGFVADRAGSEPCDIGRKAVTLYARGWARGSVADKARNHMTACDRCRGFYGDFRALRWGAAAAVPLPVAASDPGAGAGVAERVVAAGDWFKQQLYTLGGRTDPSALSAVRGPGTAAAVATCLALGTAGGVTYCATQGFPEPVRDLLPGSSNEVEVNDREQRPGSAAQLEVAPPVVTEPAPPAPTGAPGASPAPAEPPPAPEPEPEEFGFERTVQTQSSGSAADASASGTASQPQEPAAAPTSGPGEFGP